MNTTTFQNQLKTGGASVSGFIPLNENKSGQRKSFKQLWLLKKSYLIFLLLFSTLLFNEATAQLYSMLNTQNCNSLGCPRWGVNGTMGVTFNIKAYGHKVIIRRFWTELAGATNTFQILYKTDSINAAPNTGTQPWIVNGTYGPFTSSNYGTAAIDTIPYLVNITIPAGKTYGFWLSNYYTTVGTGLYYLAPNASVDTSFRTDGNIHVNMGVGVGYGGGTPSVVATPRQFVGKIEYTVVPNPPNEAGISSMTSPVSGYCAGTYPVKAIITNYGSNRIDSVRVRWKLNGVTQTGLNVSTPIDTPGHPTNSNSLEVTLAASVNFAAGVTNTIKIWTEYPNGIADTVNTDDTTNAVMHNAMNGTFTINSALPSSATNFQSFGAADSALQNYGVCGPVTINVASGTYNERVELVGPIVGVSPTNTITFDGIDAATRIITNNSTGNTQKFHTVKLEGVKYVTIKNFTINALGTDNATGVLIRGGGVSNVYIKKCTINIPNLATYPYNNYSQPSWPGYYFVGILITGGENSVASGSQKADSLQIDSNNINYGYYGIFHFGSIGGQSVNCLYRNNIINNPYYYGIYLNQHDGAKVLNNYVSMRSDAPAGSYNMYFPLTFNGTASAGNVEISGNKLMGIAGTGMYVNGINLSTNKGLITNNMIGGRLTSTAVYGVNLAACSYWSFAHNSVNFDQALTSGYLLYIGGTTGISVMNNFLSVKKPGSVALPLYAASASPIDSMDYNVFYRSDTITPSNTNQVLYLAGAYTTSTFKGAGGFNTNSKFANPDFLNDTNLHVANSCFKGMTLPYVTTDFDGTARATPPAVGAHEYFTQANDMSVVAITSPVAPFSAGAQDMTVKVKNVGTTTISIFNLSYKLNGAGAVNYVWTGSLAPCDTVSITFTSSQQITLVSTNALKVYTYGPNASLDPNRNNDTLNVTFYTPLNGAYTINPSGSGANNFTSFSSAVAAMLNAGVAGPVVFTVAAGTYSELVDITGTITGLSAATPILFDGGNGNASTRIIAGNSISQPVVRINQQRYITFRNLTITNAATGASCGAAIIGNATVNNNGTGCGFNNCTINIPNTTALSYGLTITATVNGMGLTNIWGDSIYIDSNTISGSGYLYYGIVMYGAANSSYNRNMKIRKNTVSAGYYGMFVYGMYSPFELLNNSVTMTNNGTYLGNYAYYLTTDANTSATTSSKYIGNKAFNFSNYGFYANGLGGSWTAPTQLYNNVAVSASSNSYNCLYLNASYAQVYHNTLLFNFSTSTVSYGAFQNATTYVGVKNNIFGVITAGGSASSVYLGTNPAGSDSVNYNTYYNLGTGPLGYRNGTSYYPATSGIWTAAGLGDTSNNNTPVYVNAPANNYALTSACGESGFGGWVNGYVPTDINGATRTIPPTMGAYQYNGVNNDLAVLSIISPTYPISAGSQPIKVKISNSGTTTIYTDSLKLSLNGGAPISVFYTSGGLNPCVIDSVTFTGVNLLNSINSLKIYSKLPNATTDGNRNNDTIVVALGPPLSGTYVIGTAPSDFTSFGAAITAMQNLGVGGPVNFNVKTATYNESIDFSAASIPGISATNYVTFKSQAGVSDSVIISSGNLQVVKYQNNSYLNFKNLTITQTATGNNGIVFTGTTCSFDTLYNCKINLPLQTGTSYIITSNGSYINNVVVRKCTLNGGYYGIYYSYTTSPYTGMNCVIDSNTFQNNYYYPLYINNYSQSFKVRYNSFNLTSCLGGVYQYIYVYYPDSSYEFANNIINVAANVTYFYFYPTAYAIGNVTNHARMYNNKILLASPSSYVYAYCYYSTYTDAYNNDFNLGLGYMYWSGNNNNRLYNNTISGNGNTYTLYVYTGYTGNEIRNNIISNTSVVTPLTLSGTFGATEMSDYNLYYSTSTNQVSTYTMNAWKSLAANVAVGRDRNSLSYRPPFTSSLSFVPNPADTAVWAINGRGQFLPGFGTDINNVARPTVPFGSTNTGVPDIGAYEVTPNTTTLAPLATATPATPVSGNSQWFLFGGDTLARVDYAASSTVPAAIGLRHYAGVRPPQSGNLSLDYMRAYWDMNISGYYNFSLTQYYKKPWIGTNASEAGMFMALKGAGTPWSGSTYSGVSTIDTFNCWLSTNYLVYFGYFSATDIVAPLPVKLTDFKVARSDNDALLKWTTTSEINSSIFEIERSLNGYNYTTIGKLKAAGNSSEMLNYNFNDLNAANLFSQTNTIFYRLKMIDKDGSFNYSSVVTLNQKVSGGNVNVYPNPFTNELNITLTSAQISTARVEVSDIQGRLIATRSININKGDNKITLTDISNLNAGIYFVNVNVNGETVHAKVVKN